MMRSDPELPQNCPNSPHPGLSPEIWTPAQERLNFKCLEKEWPELKVILWVRRLNLDQGPNLWAFKFFLSHWASSALAGRCFGEGWCVCVCVPCFPPPILIPTSKSRSVFSEKVRGVESLFNSALICLPSQPHFGYLEFQSKAKMRELNLLQ